MMNQQEKQQVFDPLGLYTVLKNIQTRQCSRGYICLEIGTIYGDFDLLNSKKVQVDGTEKENIHLIIKPIVIQKNVVVEKQHSPFTGIPKQKEENNNLKIKKEELEDCDFFSGHMDSLRFKVCLFYFKLQEKVDTTPTLQGAKRKFYRKVQIGEKVLANDVFKQGLNMIVLQRDIKYTKCKVIITFK